MEGRKDNPSRRLMRTSGANAPFFSILHPRSSVLHPRPRRAAPLLPDLDCLPRGGGVGSTMPRWAHRGHIAFTPASGGDLPMFTLWGASQRYCDGLSRRNFLKIGAFGAGLTLADMLRSRVGASATVPAASTNKAAIMIYLPGGPSHMDMYDLKPEAPMEYRGEFRPIATNVA